MAINHWHGITQRSNLNLSENLASFATQVCITTLLSHTHWRLKKGRTECTLMSTGGMGLWLNCFWLRLDISSYIQKMYKSTRGHAAHYQEPCTHYLVVFYVLHTSHPPHYQCPIDKKEEGADTAEVLLCPKGGEGAADIQQKQTFRSLLLNFEWPLKADFQL